MRNDILRPLPAALFHKRCEQIHPCSRFCNRQSSQEPQGSTRVGRCTEPRIAQPATLSGCTLLRTHLS